jgi:diacylglycerol kinase family enzyme
MGNTAVIYNPQKVDKVRLQSAVDGALARAGFKKASYFATTEEATGEAQARQAIADGAKLILVAGGDGTARAVFQATALTEVEVGLLPLGTGNVLARNLSIPLGNLGRAALKAVVGETHRIDLGRVTLTFADGTPPETHVFSVMAGLGLDAKIIMNTDAERKRRLGWVAYVEGGLRSLPVRFERMDVSVNGRAPKTLKLHSLLIGNCGFLPGNINLMPEAQLDDGQLDVAAVGPRRLWNWIDFWNRVTWINFLRGKIVGAAELADYTANVKTLGNMSGKTVDVTPQHPVDAQLDGDSFGKVVSAHFEVMPQAIRIRL